MNELDVSEICRRYGASVLRRCRGILRDSDDAEDAAQEVFLTVMGKGYQYRGEADLGAWIYRVTTNHCLNRLRSDKRRALREEAQQELTATVSPDPYANYTARTSVFEFMAKLDRLGQEIVVYRYLDGMTQEEIATATGKSRRTVGKRLKKIDTVIAEAGA